MAVGWFVITSAVDGGPFTRRRKSSGVRRIEACVRTHLIRIISTAERGGWERRVRHDLEKVLCQILFLFWIISHSLTCPHTFLLLCLFKSVCFSKSLSSSVGPSVPHKSGSMSSLSGPAYTYRLNHLLFSPRVFFAYSHSVSLYATPSRYVSEVSGIYGRKTYAESKWVTCASEGMRPIVVFGFRNDVWNSWILYKVFCTKGFMYNRMFMCNETLWVNVLENFLHLLTSSLTFLRSLCKCRYATLGTHFTVFLRCASWHGAQVSRWPCMAQHAHKLNGWGAVCIILSQAPWIQRLRWSLHGTHIHTISLPSISQNLDWASKRLQFKAYFMCVCLDCILARSNPSLADRNRDDTEEPSPCVVSRVSHEQKRNLPLMNATYCFSYCNMPATQ